MDQIREDTGPRTVTQAVRVHAGPVELAGSIVAPRAGGLHPALVLIPDSGDRSAGEMRPLAKALAREGIVTLIYDKRGVADSTGDWRNCDFSDLAADALACVRVLRDRPDVSNTQIGVFGIGEGGWVAPLAARDGEIAFVITLGAPGCTPIEQERYRRLRYMRAAGYGAAAMNLYTFLWLLACALWRQMPRRILASAALWRYFARISAFDPQPAWATVRQPILALWGEQDPQVPPRGSAWLLRRTLRRARHTDYTVTIVPQSDHLLQEQGAPPSAASPVLATTVGRWVRLHRDT